MSERIKRTEVVTTMRYTNQSIFYFTSLFFNVCSDIYKVWRDT